MNLCQEDFERIIKVNKTRKEFVHDSDARLSLCGDCDLEYPAIKIGNCAYVMHLTVRDKTLPMNPRITLSMVDGSRVMEPPEKCIAPWVYRTGVASYFGKPLEVLAAYCEIGADKTPIWNTMMLREAGSKLGFVEESLSKNLVAGWI